MGPPAHTHHAEPHEAFDVGRYPSSFTPLSTEAAKAAAEKVSDEGSRYFEKRFCLHHQLVSGFSNQNPTTGVNDSVCSMRSAKKSLWELPYVALSDLLPHL